MAALGSARYVSVMWGRLLSLTFGLVCVGYWHDRDMGLSRLLIVWLSSIYPEGKALLISPMAARAYVGVY